MGRVWRECGYSVGRVWGEFGGSVGGYCGDSVERVCRECKEDVERVCGECGDSVGQIVESVWGEFLYIVGIVCKQFGESLERVLRVAVGSGGRC